MPRREGAGRPKLDDPKANKVSMRLSNEELARFEAYAVKHGLSRASQKGQIVFSLFLSKERRKDGKREEKR